MERVLIVGSDPSLIATRAEILGRRYDTDLSDPRFTFKRLREQCFDLLLVCHSTPREEASALIKNVHEEFFSLPIVRLLSSSESPIENPIANKIIVIDYKPESWIRAVDELLNTGVRA